MKCVVSHCVRETASKSTYCARHRDVALANGDPELLRLRVRGGAPQGPCQVPGCAKDAALKGLCKTHYVSVRRGFLGNLAAELGIPLNPPCTFPGCGQPSISESTHLCERHYRKMRR